MAGRASRPSYRLRDTRTPAVYLKKMSSFITTLDAVIELFDTHVHERSARVNAAARPLFHT